MELSSHVRDIAIAALRRECDLLHEQYLTRCARIDLHGPDFHQSLLRRLLDTRGELERLIEKIAAA